MSEAEAPDEAAATSSRVSVADVLCRLAAWGLAGPTSLGALPEGIVGEELVERAVAERLIGVLGVAAASGALGVDDRTAERISTRHREALVWCLTLEAQLLHLHEVLEAAGVEVVVLKGPATAHLDAAEPSLRTFADLDLLVRPEAIDAAVAELSADGATRPWPPRRPDWDRRFAKSVTLRYPDGLEVDLHRTLCDGALGASTPMEALWERRELFVLGSRQIACLAPQDRFLHACYHAVVGSPSPRLMSLRDLGEAMVGAELSPSAVADEADGWGGTAVLADAIDLTVATLGLEVPAWLEVRRRLQVTRRDRAVLERQRREGSGIGRAKLDLLRVLPTWGDRGAYVRAVLWPDAAHLAARGRSRRSTLVRRR